METSLIWSDGFLPDQQALNKFLEVRFIGWPETGKISDEGKGDIPQAIFPIIFPEFFRFYIKLLT